MADYRAYALTGTILLWLICALLATHNLWGQHAPQKGGPADLQDIPPAHDVISASGHVTRRRVLVTGAAGFIGFHVARTLSQQGHHVIGIDNFNDYYDVQLKIDRAYILNISGVIVYNADLCDEAFMEGLFSSGRFTHVVHLAAQAGVRFSMQQPLAYVRANIQCHIVLLNAIKQYPKIRLVYASSSSVYGKGASVPFRTEGATSPPGNMYAATKGANELLGAHYCHAYNLSIIGLRFFTVYGPWGRPDMAVYKFCHAIFNRQQVPLFTTSGGSVLARDFTYIDDIVSGIVSSLDYRPQRCGERFNLGRGRPVSVRILIHLLQRRLDTPANITRVPLPPTEILRTWADTTSSTERLGFTPTVSLPQGVDRFVSWYKDYTLQRKIFTNISSPATDWFFKSTPKHVINT